jgi:putative hemolysin
MLKLLCDLKLCTFFFFTRILLAVGLVVVVTWTFSPLVSGELLPKKNWTKPSGSNVKAVALPMKISSIVTAPFIWLLTHSTDFY